MKLPQETQKMAKKLIFIIQCASVDSAMSEFWCYNENVFGHLLVTTISYCSGILAWKCLKVKG